MSDTAEPDLGTLVRICRALGTSPDEVLLVTGDAAPRTKADFARERVASAAAVLEGYALAYTADSVEAMLMVQRRRLQGTRPRPPAAPRIVSERLGERPPTATKAKKYHPLSTGNASLP